MSNQGSQDGQQSISPMELALFSRINNHLLFFWTPLIEFWTSSRLCVTLGQFEQMLQRIDFKRGKEEFNEMRENGINLISLDKVLNNVNEWKRHDKNVMNFLEKQKALKEESASPTKLKSKTKNTADSQLTFQFQHQKSGLANSVSRISKGTNVSTHQYLHQQQEKQSKAIEELNSNLIRTKNESNYELTIRIGEVNDICKRLKNDVSFYIVTKGEELEIIERHGKSSAEKVISSKVFEKRYHEFKTANNSLVEEIEGTLEKDLKETLVEVMYLSDELQKQITLLERKGVNN